MKNLSEDHKEIQSGKKLDDEGYMAKVEMDKIEQSLEKLRKVIKKSNHNLPSWVQSKITKSSDYLDIVADYLASDVKMDENASFSVNGASSIVDKILSELEEKRDTDPCWTGYEMQGYKKKKNKKVPNCVPTNESTLVDKILSEMLGDKPGIDIKKTKSLDKIAKKHKVSVEYLEKQLKKGIKIEMEHTTDNGEAEIIALHHLEEIPDYYTRLNKMEKSAEVKEETKSGDSNLGDWFRKSSGTDPKTGRKVAGWVQLGGPFAGAPCARQEGQKSTPKCGSSKMAANLSDKEEEKAFRRKNRKDDNQPQKSGSAKPTYVKTEEVNLQEEKEKNKKDACYHKVKSRYRVWPSAYACVPVDTSKALTKEGWKNYSELSIGEEILTYSLEKDLLEFKPILNLFYYDDAPTYVVQNGNTGWRIECTPNHKWVIKHPKCEGSRGRKKFTNLINDMRLVSIEELLNESGSNRKLVISAQYNEGDPLVLEKIYKYGTNWINYLIECSPEQRQSWLYSAIVYDGNQNKTERILPQTNQTNEEYLYDSPSGKQSFGFKQKDVVHRDAFLISAFLNRGIVTFSKHKNCDIFNCNYISYNGTKSVENFKLINERKRDVWCPQTENGTWVMMQETDGKGVITITGNSGALVKCRKVGASNWGEKVDEAVRLPMQTGQLLRVLVNWRGKHLSVQMFFPQLGTPKRNEIAYAVNQIYPEARVISYVPCEMDSNTPIVQVKEDWQKVNKKDRVDGMSQKAVNTYRRENPGSKLQTAVTEKNPTGKRRQRRTNYCTRSKGQQEMHNISCSKTPDKPICKARRRWNCKN